MKGGGIVLATKSVENLIWISYRDDATDIETAIYVMGDDKARSVSDGDTITWDGALVLWTPRLKRTLLRGPREVKLIKVGDSSVIKKQTKRKN